MKISYEAHDFDPADIYYHNSCYIKFALKNLSTTVAEEQNMLELNVFEEFCLQIKKRIICGKEAFSFSDLLEDVKLLCEKNGSEESIIRKTRTLKRKIIDTFPEEISFYPNEKYLIVHSSDVNPSQYIVAVPKGKGLRDGDIIKSFGNMIRRKVRSIKNEKIYPTWSYSRGEMFDLLMKGPLQELCNVIFYIIKGSFKLNHVGYAETTEEASH